MKPNSTTHRHRHDGPRIGAKRRVLARRDRVFTLLIWFVLSLFHSCEKPVILLNQPNEDVRSLGGFIGNNFDYSLFAAALEYTGLMDTLANSPGPFTVLAPNNNAFSELGISHASMFQGMDRDSLRLVLEYHILPYRLSSEDMPPDENDLRYVTMSGDSLYASRLGDVFVAGNSFASAQQTGNSALNFSGAYALVNDAEFSNGVMHTLIKVMKPFPRIRVQQWLEDRAQYGIFVAGLKKFGLWDELAGEGPFTIFAVQDDVFTQWGITEESIAAMDVSQYIAARLFGSYIMYDRHYFISDNHFYFHAGMVGQRQMWYVSPLRDDTSYHQIFMGREAANILTQSLTVYSLAISQLQIPYNFRGTNNAQRWQFNQENFLGSGRQVYGVNGYNLGRIRARNDNICDNGLVHDLQAVLVMPEEARVE